MAFVVDADHAGARLDAFLAGRLTAHSRSRLRRSIESGQVTIDGRQAKASYRIRSGETIAIAPLEVAREGPQPENISLDILFEDAWLVAVNKPPGMVVHPSRGHGSGTLAAALAFHFQQLSSVGGPARPGIVHRLDRDTSGVIIIAKTDRAHLNLAKQFERRTTEKEYLALVVGTPNCDRDVISQPIGAHPHQREKMALRSGHVTSRSAETFYEVERRFRGFALLRVWPKAGRTHQIRLHLAHLGCPVLCDRLYGGRAQITLGEVIDGREDERVLLGRQALHARRIKLRHPETGDEVQFEAPLPGDIRCVLERLTEYRAI